MSSLKPMQFSEHLLKSQFSLEEQYLLRPLRSVAVGSEVMVKFHANNIQSKAKKNPFVSWTLNKAAVIDQEWLRANKSNDELPIKEMDWWRVKIEEETSPGQPVGCFILRPLWRVERTELAILAPSTWDCVTKGLTVFLYPKIRPWMPWIIPKALRKAIMRKTGGASLVIPLGYPSEEVKPAGLVGAATSPELDLAELAKTIGEGEHDEALNPGVFEDL